MSSSSCSMDYQKKPIKVKSRWAQSSQMELMMIEESQSSLDMSDSITDVSTSDFNDISDYSSELNAIELRRSRRTHNRADYRQLNVLKTSSKKKCIASNSSNKRGRKKNQSSNTTDINKDDKCKDNVMQEPNDFIVHPSVDWKNIKIFQSKRRSKSVNNVNEDIEKCSPKLIRRASLSWKFKFTNEVEDISNIVNKCYRFNISNEIKNLNLNDASSKIISSSNDDKQLRENDKLAYKDNTTIKNASQLSHYSDVNILKYEKFDGKIKKVLNNTEFDEISATNYNKNKQFYELNTHVNQCNEEKSYQFNNSVVHNSFLSELENLKQSPNIKSREVRSKSLDSYTIKTNCIFKRFKSYDDIYKLKPLTVDTLKFQKVQTRSQKKKRRQSKRIKPKINGIEILDDMKVPEVNYDKVADEIYREHKNQLFEARNKDKEFDDILKSTNFTLVNENVYRPNRQTLKMYPPSEITTLRKLKQRVISGDINDYCECTLSKEDIIVGNTGCDDRCLNRLLKVECGSGCSLKRYCTNKQFQNKQFKKTNIIKTEQKGYGICAVEDIPKGVLINEYVGEVIDYNEMCNRLRKKEYANLNYLVQLNPDEIIDSTSKGNLTRFINHSCDPNSVGEKWHVLGQSRIGFFSTRPIKKGEEITFDYSFQIFGDGAQICYCGSSNCRGYISKATLINSNSNSENSDDATEDHRTSKYKKKQIIRRNLNTRIVNNDENKLRELRRQLTEIAKLKTGLKADQEMAMLNLNRLMVHITDSVSRLHVLTFIREHDMNKRLFMDFSGLSIIHNWMTSNENESFKLMILDILSELPITNRNTITKSKVLDVVAEWAEISQDIKIKIESLEYPTTELQKHVQEIENMLPTNKDNESMNGLIEKARALWKKWIVLKMVFKIPKKIDQHKPIEEINLNKVDEDLFSSASDISTLDRKPLRITNKYASKVRNQQTISLDRMKLRKEYELKIEQERKNKFRKKVMDDWFENFEGVMKNKPNQHFSHQQTLNSPNCDNSMFNHNNEIIKQPRWDCSPQVPLIVQNPIVNYNMQMPCSNFMPLQVIQQQQQFSQYSFTQPQVLPNYHLINQQTVFNTPPPPLPNQKLIKRPLNSIILPDKPVNEIIENSDLSPSKHLLELADNNVFNLINESLHKHYNKNKNIDTGTEHPPKMCSRIVQSGADLLARIKVISNSFKKQPSKLIKIKHLKQRNDKKKLKNIPLSDLMLKSVCDKNKRITFINEQNGVMSNTLSKDLVPLPKTIPLSGKNKFAHAIFTTLIKKARLQKENLVPIKLVSKGINSDLITCDETDKEIELYKNIKPKVIKKVVSHIKVKNGLAAVIKRQWGMKLKGLKRSHEKIPATKRNIMRKGNIHKLALKNCLVNKTKSALKRQSSVNVDDCIKRPKEKRVSFLIEGETSPIFPNSKTLTKQKPLMKCHPFEIRNETKSILLPSTSAVQDDNLQFPKILEQSFDTTISYDQIIEPIVSKFKASRSKYTSSPDNQFEIDLLQSKRKNLIPQKLTTSLSLEVLKLFPDNKKEMKKVIDFHHAMAKVIVKTLGSYAKTNCVQGRIRNDDDFKFLAKKLNDNVLLKELQCKKVDKLKISNSTMVKVSEYINRYMSRFGEVYKKKPKEQTNHNKST